MNVDPDQLPAPPWPVSDALAGQVDADAADRHARRAPLDQTGSADG